MSRNKWVCCFVSLLYHKCFWLISRPFGGKKKKEKRLNDSFCSFILATVLAERKCLFPYSFSLNLDILHHLAFTPHQRCFHNILLYNYFYCTDLFFFSLHAFKCDILLHFCMKWIRVGITGSSHAAFHLLKELLWSGFPQLRETRVWSQKEQVFFLLFTISEHSKRSWEWEGTRNRVSLG